MTAPTISLILMAAYDKSQPCQCNTACSEHNDCCSDYADQCQGPTTTPGPSPPGEITDQDIKDFSEQIFGMYRPEALSKVSLNLQSETSTCGPDNAPERYSLTLITDISRIGWQMLFNSRQAVLELLCGHLLHHLEYAYFLFIICY